MAATSYKAFLPELVDRIQAVSDAYLGSYDEHAAFVYLVAEMFETTRPDRFVYTDGPKDGGVDFYIGEIAGYTIAQCKCPDLDLLGDSPQVYDQAPLDELKAAIDIMLDKSGEYDVRAQIKRLRGDYQRDRATDAESTTLTAILAVMGTLSESSMKAFNSYKASLRRERVFLKLIQWEDIYHAIHALESPSDLDFEVQLNFDSEADILAHKDYCYVLCHAFDLYEAFRKHEWNLFEWNVRFQIPNSPVNKRIVAALSKAKTRRLFHHYNNGLLITCKSYRKDLVRKRLTMVGPQVVNGCQTVRAICEAYEALSPEDQQNLREESKVQVKVISTTDAELISELVISTNDQNPMNPRNLKSNTAEQRDIQKQFRGLPQKWFYERKDGEFKSLLTTSAQVRWFRKSDFAVSPKKYRVIDNQELSKTWYSFTGNSHIALRGGIDYFREEEDSAYTRIFRSTPAPAFWSAFAQATFEPIADYFSPGVPSVYQFLFAAGIGNYVDSRRVSFRINRLEAIRRGIKSGKLRGDPDAGHYISTPREIDEYVGSDLEYILNIMINNMREVIIELYSFILCLKYTTCDAQTCQKLIANLPRLKGYFECGFDASILLIKQDGSSLLGPIYEFLCDSIKQYYFEYQAEIKAAPRLKSYLAQRNTINRLRSTTQKRNKGIVQYDVEWKKPNKTFINSLPDL